MSQSLEVMTCPDTKLRCIVLDGKKYVLKEDLQLSFDGAPEHVRNYLCRVGGWDEPLNPQEFEDLPGPFPARTRPRHQVAITGTGPIQRQFPEYVAPVKADPERVSQIQASDDMSEEELKELCGGAVPEIVTQALAAGVEPPVAVAEGARSRSEGEGDLWDEEFDEQWASSLMTSGITVAQLGDLDLVTEKADLLGELGSTPSGGVSFCGSLSSMTVVARSTRALYLKLTGEERAELEATVERAVAFLTEYEDEKGDHEDGDDDFDVD